MEEKKHCKWYNDEFCTNGDSPCVADYCPVVEYPELCKCKEIDEDTSVCSKDDTDTNVGMTNEEIIKALEIGSKCCEHNYLEYWELVRACQNGLDLIQHLQGENAGLKERGEIVINSLHETIDTQKAEIERLTEEHERIAWSKQQYLDWVHGFLTTHTDMKNRGEDYKMFDRDWMCGVFWEKIEGSIEYIIDLENQRNELQKQVDELKEQLLIAKLQGLTEGYLDGVQAERNAQIIKPTIVELPKEITQKIKEQAVKDTAKEILDEVSKHFGGKWLVELYKKYGLEWSVEVE